MIGIILLRNYIEPACQYWQAPLDYQKNQRYHLVRAFNSQHLFLLESDFVIIFYPGN